MPGPSPLSSEATAHFLRSFPTPPGADRGWAVYCPPGQPELIAIGIVPAAGRKQPSGAPCWYSPQFFSENSEGPWFPALQVEWIRRAELVARLEIGDKISMNWKWAPRGDTALAFQGAAASALERISRRELEKVVPIAFLERAGGLYQPTQEQLAHCLLSALRFHAENGGSLYGLWDQTTGILGVTPETLFEISGDELTTMALAGTRPMAETLEETTTALLSDPKERREHDIVVSGIRQSLEGLGPIETGITGVRRAGRLLHLHTPLRLKFVGAPSWEDLVKRLHPTPALGASPREPGMAWLRDLEERAPRLRFGAPFGVRLNELDHCVVAIRNMEWSAARRVCRIGAGAGVVAGSTPEREWTEIQRKWSAVLQILGLGNLDGASA